MSLSGGMNGRWLNTKIKTGEMEKSKTTIKVRLEGTVEEFVDKFEYDLSPKFSKHLHYVGHPCREIRKMREPLEQNQMILHIDFSENYGCKYHEEVQSVLFRQSNISRPILAFSIPVVKPFSTVSECKRHDANAYSHILTKNIQIWIQYSLSPMVLPPSV